MTGDLKDNKYHPRKLKFHKTDIMHYFLLKKINDKNFLVSKGSIYLIVLLVKLKSALLITSIFISLQAAEDKENWQFFFFELF